MTRKILFWTHLCIGVVAGAAILIMSATGVLLAFERQLLQLVDRDLRTVSAPADAPPRRLGEMLATVSASAGSLPSGVVVRPSAVGLGRVHVRPGSHRLPRSLHGRRARGGLEGRPASSSRPSSAGIARSANPFARAARCARSRPPPTCCSWCWWPPACTCGFPAGGPGRRSGRPCCFGSGLQGRARDFNWHNVAGVWCALPLLLITATGVVISYPWANAWLFRLAGSAAPATARGRTASTTRGSRSRAGRPAAARRGPRPGGRHRGCERSRTGGR